MIGVNLMQCILIMCMGCQFNAKVIGVDHVQCGGAIVILQ